MKRWAVFAMLAGSAFALTGSCQGPDAFYRPRSSGFGGFVGSGTGGSGLGGFIGSGLGGNGLGGFVGTGAGGRSTVGTGGRGAGGAIGTGGMIRVDGGGTDLGPVGTGGRMMVDAGGGCIGTMIASGYAAGTAAPCSQCNENGMSLTAKCTMMIDCLAPSCANGNCYLECFHSVSGSDPLDRCVKALVMAACGP